MRLDQDALRIVANSSSQTKFVCQTPDKRAKPNPLDLTADTNCLSHGVAATDIARMPRADGDYAPRSIRSLPPCA